MQTTSGSRRRKVGVVLFNLGGPDGPDDVQPFLFNLFNDPAIIGAPGPVRWALANYISRTREKSAKANYALMGGGSPLLPGTKAQAAALDAALAEVAPEIEARAFIAMRYWTPFVADAANAVRAWGADEVVLLPLYPQYSTTTTGSSLTAWRKAAPDIRVRTVCCYPREADFIAAHARLIRETWETAGAPANARVLFSAHGLPERVVKAGDPYQWQVEETSSAVAALLPELEDWAICYQSRVGPLTWIGPSTEDEIRRAGADGKAVILSPIAFVSEHIETLVELDDEYAELARHEGVSAYHRAPALGEDAQFIKALAGLVLGALNGGPGLKPPGGARICPAAHGRCPNAGG